MKKLIKLLSLAMAFVLLITLCSCGNSSSSSSVNTIDSESEAIAAVKDSFNIEQRIASAAGFAWFGNPDYGTSQAEEKGDGYWRVTIKGNLSGYTDEYKTDLDIKKFTVAATVDSEGNVSNFDVEAW